MLSNVLLFVATVCLIFGPCGILCAKKTPTPTPTPTPVSPSSNLGILAGLAGTWMGSGFVQISLPDFDSTPPSTGPKPFRLLLHNTRETLVFTPIGGAIPNRGSVTAFGAKTGQDDINIFGLTYLQRVCDAVTSDALHVETGMWIIIPPTDVLPVEDQTTIVRMGTIPHGDALLAQDTFFLQGGTDGPFIQPVSSIPVSVPPTPPLGPVGTGYLRPFNNTPGFDTDVVINPNLLLLDAIADQTIIDTDVIVISTSQVGGILNIPFVETNANVTSFDAIFWIETILNADGTTFQQLQYTQTIVLNFLGIDWPHITVATLVQQ